MVASTCSFINVADGRVKNKLGTNCFTRVLINLSDCNHSSKQSSITSFTASQPNNSIINVSTNGEKAVWFFSMRHSCCAATYRQSFSWFGLELPLDFFTRERGQLPQQTNPLFHFQWLLSWCQHRCLSLLVLRPTVLCATGRRPAHVVKQRPNHVRRQCQFQWDSFRSS